MNQRFAAPASWAFLGAAALCLGAAAAPIVGDYPAAISVGIALFFVPGRLLLVAIGSDAEIGLAETPAAAFAASLAAITPACLAPFLFGGTLSWFVPGYVTTLAALTLLAGRRRSPGPGNSDSTGNDHPRMRAVAQTDASAQSDRPDRVVVALVCVLAVVATAAAWKLTQTGSIDRWWYLAYVRSYMQSPSLDFGEPFFDATIISSRFGFNVWLSALAVWAQQSGIDPIRVYERMCPLILVPSAFSAALWFGRVLFGSRRTAWLFALASGLVWLSGSLFPVLTRMPEDKILALLILAPATGAAALSVLRKANTGRLWLLSAAVVAQASVHPLVYVLAALPVAFATVWLLATRQSTFAAATALFVIFAAGGVYPAVGGAGARTQLVNNGAALNHPDHPVTRVHLSRARLVLLEDGSYFISPRLLFHPLMILALACVPFLLVRPRMEKAYLLPATLLPPAVAFVPAVAGLAGSMVLPWMVYRVLWLIPYAALLTVGVEESAKRIQRYRAGAALPVAMAALVIVAAPSIVRVLANAPTPERLALATPERGPFRTAMEAVAALDQDAIIAASPEISERIPAFTGRRVLAASDRATVVFSASRKRGEDRLRIRAALMAGVWRPHMSLPATAIDTPTHLLIAPDAIAARYCGRRLFESDGFNLCELTTKPTPDSSSLVELAVEPAARGGQRLELTNMLGEGPSRLGAHCTPTPDSHEGYLFWPRSGPWSASLSHLQCTIHARSARDDKIFRPHAIDIRPLLGRAVEELTVVVAGDRGGRRSWRGTAQIRLHSGEQTSLVLPRNPIDTLSVTVVPDFLPFLKLETLSLEFE